MARVNQQTKRYSAAERKAYYMGVGAAIGFGKVSEIKRAANRMSETEKRSFYNGFDDRATKRRK